MLERSCNNCKHYPAMQEPPTINDWSKRCWDCVGVSNFAKIHLALFEPKDSDIRKEFLENLNNGTKAS